MGSQFCILASESDSGCCKTKSWGPLEPVTLCLEKRTPFDHDRMTVYENDMSFYTLNIYEGRATFDTSQTSEGFWPFHGAGPLPSWQTFRGYPEPVTGTYV